MTPPRAENGQAIVETALVGLVVMVLALGLLQFGIWYHGQHVILGAAQESAHAAALDGSNPTAGRARARELVSAGLGSLPERISVSSSTTDRIATTRVEARMASLVPFFPHLTLRAEGRAFRERFVPAGVRP